MGLAGQIWPELTLRDLAPHICETARSICLHLCASEFFGELHTAANLQGIPTVQTLNKDGYRKIRAPGPWPQCMGGLHTMLDLPWACGIELSTLRTHIGPALVPSIPKGCIFPSYGAHELETAVVCCYRACAAVLQHSVPDPANVRRACCAGHWRCRLGEWQWATCTP